MSRCNLRRTRLRTLSSSIPDRAGIFKRHTDLIEPLSLDEAYLTKRHGKQDSPADGDTRRAYYPQAGSAGIASDSLSGGGAQTVPGQARV
jgi:nucleotidyltransferase/DNA polymerase involved in DNA repair